MQFSLDRKRRSHKQNQCSASDSVGLIFTRSYHFTLLITTPTTTPSLVKTSLKHSKSKSTTVPVSSPAPISSEDSGAKLTYDQQIQLVQLQKEKLRLELQVLTLSRRERPQENMCEGFAEDFPVAGSTTQRRPKRSIYHMLKMQT